MQNKTKIMGMSGLLTSRTGDEVIRITVLMTSSRDEDGKDDVVEVFQDL
jgi:hypothetical protein